MPLIQTLSVEEVKGTALKPSISAIQLGLLPAEQVIAGRVRKKVKEVPIIPKGDGCCIPTCKYLNEKIKELDEDIIKRDQEIEKMVMGSKRTLARKGRRSLENQVMSLEEYRRELKKRDSCKCIQ